jgi:hypothetical protein
MAGHRDLDPVIEKTAMAYITSVADKIQPLTMEMWTRVSVVLTASCNLAVIQLASNLVFMLIPKLQMEWDAVETQVILPLFATSSDELETILLNGLFHTLLPLVGDKVLPVISKVSQLLIDLNQVLPLLTEEICGLTSHEGESYKQTCVEIASGIVRSAAAEENVVEIALDRAGRYFPVVSECVKKALVFRSMRLILKGLPLLIELGAQTNQVQTGEILIAVLDFAKDLRGSGSSRLLPLICDLLEQNGYGFLAERRLEFQRVLFEFFTHESADVRALIKRMAVASHSLFSS